MERIIIANFKCNPKTANEALKLFSLISKTAKNKKTKVVVCPPSIYLTSLKKTKNVSLGLQNAFFKEGAFTGEISFKMGKSVKTEYALIGHSERRNIFNETNEEINEKIKEALNNLIKPVLCIGESREERASGETFIVLQKQIEQGLNKLSKEKIKNIIIAYEPVWAIGTGEFADPEKMLEAKIFIKKLLINKYGKAGDRVKIIYGGSVDDKNIASYITEAQMDGVLVGGASLDAKKFSNMIKIIEKVK